MAKVSNPMWIRNRKDFPTEESWLAQAFADYHAWANQPAHLTATPQPEQPAAGDYARELYRKVLTAGGWRGPINSYQTAAEQARALTTLRTGLSDYVAGLVVPDGEVPDWHNGVGLDHFVFHGDVIASHLRQHGFLIIKAPEQPA